jgi:uncharacterized membrane protein YfcA
MEALFGFLIAIVIGMTGAGGGTLAVPVLVLACGLPATEAVGTSMVFATVVKLLSVPVYLWRRQFSTASLVRLLKGGLPGVLFGALLLSGLHTRRFEHAVLAIVGGTTAVLAVASLWRLRHAGPTRPRQDLSRWLPWVGLPIGLEVGFSSAGAGALGGIALMSLTPLTAPAVVGTDLMFGFGLSAVGGGLHFALGNVNVALACRLLTGGIAGALAGPWLATRIPVRTMRAVLSATLSVLGGQLFWRGIAPMLGSW